MASRAWAWVLVGIAVGCNATKAERKDLAAPRDTDGAPTGTQTAGGVATHSPPAPASRLRAEAVAELALSPEGAMATQRLSAASHFGGWAVGAAGSPTPPVEDLRVVVREKNAAKALQLVLQHGTPAGQLMALAGLFDVDPALFAKELPAFRSKAGEVRLMTSGCMPGGDPTPIAAVVEAANAVRLSGPTDDLAAWSTRNPGKPIELDISGGGYTAAMRAP
jgi:hypothetical protein